MSMGSGPHIAAFGMSTVAAELEWSTVCGGGMNSPDTSAAGGPSASQPRPGDEFGAAAPSETAVEAAPPIPGVAERAIARWENAGGWVRA